MLIFSSIYSVGFTVNEAVVVRYFFRFFIKIVIHSDVEMVVIAAINGHDLGGGCELALA